MYKEATKYCRQYLREIIAQSEYIGTSHNPPMTRFNILFRPLTTFSDDGYLSRNLDVGKNEIVLSVHTDEKLNFDYPDHLDFRFIPGDIHNSQFFLSLAHNERSRSRLYWQGLVSERKFNEFCEDVVGKLEVMLEVYPENRDVFFRNLASPPQLIHR
ncbi:MAG: hypothetical protein ACMXYE_04485 [Candidatus Woesearchaeota archaeon]